LGSSIGKNAEKKGSNKGEERGSLRFTNNPRKRRVFRSRGGGDE